VGVAVWEWRCGSGGVGVASGGVGVAVWGGGAALLLEVHVKRGQEEAVCSRQQHWQQHWHPTALNTRQHPGERSDRKSARGGGGH
jgi:hypothetical protein